MTTSTPRPGHSRHTSPVDRSGDPATTGMPEHPLAGALRIVAARRATGALEARGETATGTVWFHEGDITWARLAGERLDLDGVFDPELLLRTLSSPTADHDLGTALLEAGVTEDCLARLTAAALERTLAALADDRGLELRFTSEGNWFGSRCRFDAGHWADRVEAEDLEIDLRPRERLSA